MEEKEKQILIYLFNVFIFLRYLINFVNFLIRQRKFYKIWDNLIKKKYDFFVIVNFVVFNFN